MGAAHSRNRQRRLHVPLSKAPDTAKATPRESPFMLWGLQSVRVD